MSDTWDELCKDPEFQKLTADMNRELYGDDRQRGRFNFKHTNSFGDEHFFGVSLPIDISEEEFDPIRQQFIQEAEDSGRYMRMNDEEKVAFDTERGIDRNVDLSI